MPDQTELLDAALVAREADKTNRDGALVRMDVLVEWLVTPAQLRMPRTKKELATALGVSTETLRKYETDPWVRKEFLKRSRSAFTVARAADVIDTLYQRATDATDPQGVSAARTLMQFFENVDQDTGSEHVDLSAMSRDDLVELAMRVAGS
jgi:hypothetical protein